MKKLIVILSLLFAPLAFGEIEVRGGQNHGSSIYGKIESVGILTDEQGLAQIAVNFRPYAWQEYGELIQVLFKGQHLDAGKLLVSAAGQDAKFSLRPNANFLLTGK